MTPQELRQLDLRMAELCGLKLMTRNVRNWFWKETERYWLFPDGREMKYTDWKPTERIEQAFLVIDRIRKRGYDFSLLGFKEIGSEYGCHIHKAIRSSKDRYSEGFWGKNINPALSICIAADKVRSLK